MRVDEFRRGQHVGEIAGEQTLDAGAAHLDGHIALAVAIADPAPCAPGRWRRRRRARRSTGTACRSSGRTPPRSAGSRRRAGNGSVRSLQTLQGAHHGGADDVRPRRQELTELHVGRAEAADRAGQGGEARPRGLPADHFGEGDRQLRHRRQEGRIDVVEDCRPGPTRSRHAPDGRRSPAGRSRRPSRVRVPARERLAHSFQPWWIATMPPDNRTKRVLRKPAARDRAPRTSRRRGTCGWTRRDSDSSRRRRSRPGRCAGSRLNE